MTKTLLIKLAFQLAKEAYGAYQEAKKQEKLDELQKNPSKFLANHFNGRLPNDEASKAEPSKHKNNA